MSVWRKFAINMDGKQKSKMKLCVCACGVVTSGLLQISYNLNQAVLEY
jgi:hypothetical protein